MRLPTIAPDQLTAEQRPLFDTLNQSIDRYLQGYVTRKADGTLIGPFNALLHAPKLGNAFWPVFLALNDQPALPPLAREVVILVTGAKNASMYELYSHEAVTARAGMDAVKIRTIAAGQRPTDLSEDEALAYDVASVVNRGAPVPESLYRAAEARYGVAGMSEIAFMVGCYTLICALLAVFDVALPTTEGA